MRTSELREITSAPLTREQVKLLRKRGRIFIGHRPGGGYIRVIEETDRFDEMGRSIEIDHDPIPVESRVVEFGYLAVEAEEAKKQPLAEVAHCSVMISSSTASTHDRYWRTIAQLIKPGNSILLAWGRDYDSNHNTKVAGLHLDRLTLFVKQGEGDSDILTFVVPTSVCKDDTARTIRRGVNNNL